MQTLAARETFHHEEIKDLKLDRWERGSEKTAIRLATFDTSRGIGRIPRLTGQFQLQNADNLKARSQFSKRWNVDGSKLKITRQNISNPPPPPPPSKKKGK